MTEKLPIPSLEDLRSEEKIMRDLEEVCTSPGYIHALAWICLESERIHSTPENLPLNRLVRNETTALAGLMIKASVNMQMPSDEVMEYYIKKSKELLWEYESNVKAKALIAMNEKKINGVEGSITPDIRILRYSFLYGPEPAYTFQYEDFSKMRYRYDEKWLLENKNFRIADAIYIIKSISEMQKRKIAKLCDKSSKIGVTFEEALPAFTFTLKKVVEISGYSAKIVKSVLEAFSLPSIPCNENFINMDDFHEMKKYPVIPIAGGYILFDYYNFVAAIYSTPFFWMWQNENYVREAEKHRGLFPEEFSKQCLQKSLGKERVYKNIKIMRSKSHTVGEIDALAVFADRCIVVQAKSKMLTAESYEGNEDSIRDDFEKAVQRPYDQGLICAEALLDERCKLKDKDGREIRINRKFTEIFLICVLSDLDPALRFHASRFLQHEGAHPIISLPYVIDVFTLDAICKMLDTPLYLFDFLHKRTKYASRIFSGSEFSILSFYLSHNLHIKEDNGILGIDESFAVELDMAMAARRYKILDRETPRGILTMFEGSIFDSIFNYINAREDGDLLTLGYLLLEHNGEGLKELDEKCAQIIENARNEHEGPGLVIKLGDSAGVTIYSGRIDLRSDTFKRTWNACEVRKYENKAEIWYGIILNPDTKAIELIFSISRAQKQSDRMDHFVNIFPPLSVSNVGRPIN